VHGELLMILLTMSDAECFAARDSATEIRREGGLEHSAAGNEFLESNMTCRIQLRSA